MTKRKIPGAKEWHGYEADLDVRYAHKLLFGKSTSEVVTHFADARCIERADELLYMPRAAFQYYIFAFVEYIRSAQAAKDSDAGSVFLRLLADREKKDPGSVRAIYSELRDAVHFVAENQEYFAASPDIYGSFKDLGAEVDRLCA
jgi:hypothetical protein